VGAAVVSEIAHAALQFLKRETLLSKISRRFLSGATILHLGKEWGGVMLQLFSSRALQFSPLA